MSFKKLLVIGFFVFSNTVNASVSNIEGAGMCVGHMLIGTNQYKIPGKDWDANAKVIFNKYFSTFQRLNPLMQNCLQGSGNEQVARACLAKLPTQNDRDFYTGLTSGISSADRAWSKGGADLVKMQGGLLCSGIK